MCLLEALAGADRLTFVDLARNPWRCDCRLRRPPGVGSAPLTAAWDRIVCRLPAADRGKLLSTVVGRGSTVVCESERLPGTERPPASPLDLVRRRWTYLLVATLVISVLGVVVVAGVLRVRRSRAAVWTPCHDAVDTAASSVTSRSYDVDVGTGDVIKARDDVTAHCGCAHNAPSVA